eukprot:CAMPEP_0170450852 /NCGR_PEP_ID=MMETSP0123-20130129/260_1 /TAXON_ID=182087 /ORGANISM="Favella ehrenbergii, Strain Fehren 1" /LENGTH=60 /DNA_ID=CAMNT_0010712291 /DNA_START=354 /DNA_END=536 /DNA_ORIENTATION=-
MHDTWDECAYDFDTWTYVIVGLMFCSIALSILQMYSRKQMKAYVQRAEQEALKQSSMDHT